MAFQDSVDFSKYGLNWKITPELTTMPLNFKDNISTVERKDKNKLIFTKPNGEKTTLQLQNILGAGTYGEAWSSDTLIEKDIPIVVKIISFNRLKEEYVNGFVYDTVQEALIQILIYEATKNIRIDKINLRGPFAPKFFLMGRDNDAIYIVMERLHSNLFDMLKQKNKSTSWTPPTGAFIKNSTLQICKILQILYEKLNYNHRDLKPDNIMYNIIDGNINIRLIDFGFSCLKYKNMAITSVSETSYASELQHCDSSVRDIHAYFYYLLHYTYYAKMDCPLKRVLNALMTSDQTPPKNWTDTYLVYDEKNADTSKEKSLNLNPDVVYNVFNSIDFIDTNSCTEFSPKWTKNLVKIYSSTLVFLTKDEILHINPSIREQVLYARGKKILFDMSTVFDPETIDMLFNTYVDLKNINDTENFTGLTPLAKAAKYNNIYLVKKLLNTGNALTTITDIKGKTCLHYAVDNTTIYASDPEKYRTAFEIVKLLIAENPALPNIKDKNKKRPGSRKYAKVPEVSSYVKSRKSTFFKRRPDTNRTKWLRATRRSPRFPISSETIDVNNPMSLV